MPKIGEQYGKPVENYLSHGMNNSFNKNNIYWVEEYYGEKPSILPHVEEDQTNSK